MKVKIILPLFTEWERGIFPTFAKETKVAIKQEDKDFRGWHEAEIEGHQTFIPKHFVSDGKLVRDYNPTELVGEVGDLVEVQEIHHAWLLATDEQGTTGWIPSAVVISINEG